MFTGTVSDRKCFLCSSTDSLEVKFKDKSFTGIICWEHLKKLVRRNENPDDSGHKRTIETVEK